MSDPQQAIPRANPASTSGQVHQASNSGADRPHAHSSAASAASSNKARRPQTADQRVQNTTFRPTVVRPASHIGARSAKERERVETPPWAVKDDSALPTAHQLKEEYQAMKNQEIASQMFEQKLNVQRDPVNVQHMQKDWRWYQHIGSKGNLWNDMHMTPQERRHLVVTPTVIRGYRQQERTLEKRLAEEEEQKALRMEQALLMRQQRRFQIQEQQMRTALLQDKARQSRPGTSASSQFGAAGRALGESRPGTTGTDWRMQSAPGSVMTGVGSVGGSSGAGAAGRREVSRPASQLEGRSYRRFEYTTMLTSPEWEAACRSRDSTRQRLAWELARPDRHRVALQQAYNKEQLEVAFLQKKQARLQSQRQNRIQTLRGRSQSRQDLELRSGQATARIRQHVAMGATSNRPCWQPSGYGVLVHQN